MSPVLIIVLVVVASIVVTYLFGLSPDPTRGRRAGARHPPPTVQVAEGPARPSAAGRGRVPGPRLHRLPVQRPGDVPDDRPRDGCLGFDGRHRTSAPNRLAAAEGAANAFLDSFHPISASAWPPSQGKPGWRSLRPQARSEVVNALGALTTSRGTVIGDGLIGRVGRDRGRARGPRRRRAAVLLSDGRDTGSAVPPRRGGGAGERVRGPRLHGRRWARSTDEGAGAEPRRDRGDRHDQRRRDASPPRRPTSSPHDLREPGIRAHREPGRRALDEAVGDRRDRPRGVGRPDARSSCPAEPGGTTKAPGHGFPPSRLGNGSDGGTARDPA